MSAPIFVPRSTWFTGIPTSNSGTPRPLLRLPVPILTRHYTGSWPSSKARTWSAREFMPHFQTVALASGKSYEYGYCIPPRIDGSSQVWEYAGDYQAAHSAGENDVAIGVIFLIGVANHPSFKDYDPNKPTVWEPLTDEMVDAYRWLRDVHLKGRGVVAANVAQIEHRFMPGAATPCPGSSVMARAADLLAPYVPPMPPEDPMPLRVFKVEANPMPSPPPLFATGDGVTAVWLSAAQHQALGAPPWEDVPLARAQARRYTLVGDCPNGYHGIWGQDALL